MNGGQARRLKMTQSCNRVRLWHPRDGGLPDARDGPYELAEILEFIRPGDELVVVKLDRNVLNLVHELEQKGAGLRVLEPGMVAEMERKFILERQRAGIEAAKAKGGVYMGRKPSVPAEEVRRLHGEGKGPAEIAAALGAP